MENSRKIELTLDALHLYSDLLRKQRLSSRLIRKSIDETLSQTEDAIARVEIMDSRKRFAGEDLEIHYRDHRVLSLALRIYISTLESEMDSFVKSTGADHVLYERMDDLKRLKSMIQRITPRQE